jgi:lysyl-tRNA synthetase class 2
VIEPQEEALLEENDQIRVRAEKRRRLEEEGVVVYPSAYPVTHTAALAVAAFADGRDGPTVRVAGRVVSRRGMGRASFLHLLDRSGKVQVYVRRDAVGEEAYDRMTLLDLGDFVGVHGTMFRTKAGEITVHASEWTFLAKAMRPLPEKFHGLADKEIRFRQRYLDLIANEQAREIFRSRSRIVSAMRAVLDGRDFLEVETPILQPVYGGANARPFRTGHNALGVTLFLRIADELYLKRCLVGGFERVYEFGKDFRNEGMDKSHQPEFTMLEAYQAYADYRDGMELVEELVRAAAVAANGSAVACWRGHSLDFGGPWARIPFFEALERATGRDLSACDEALLAETCEEHRVELAPRSSVGKMLDELFSATVQRHLVQPTFIVDHPKVLSPLSKEKPGGRGVVERYEPIVCGMEIGNGFSELNDPVEQRARFEAQLAMADRDEDTMVLDEAFLRALEHGMPPASGLGIGLDRLVMILTGAEQIREVILFPAMRPEEGRTRGNGEAAEAEP